MSKDDGFPEQSVLDALNSAVEASAHLTSDQKPVVALGRVLAKRVDALEAANFVIDGRFDNVSSGMFLKVLDALGLTVKMSRSGRVLRPDESLVPPAKGAPVSEPEPETPVTDMERFRRGRGRAG